MSVQHILHADMDKFVLSDLKNQYASFGDVNRLVKERYELKVELTHYAAKVGQCSSSVICSTFTQIVFQLGRPDNCNDAMHHAALLF